jgi:hypothetical protein
MIGCSSSSNKEDAAQQYQHLIDLQEPTGIAQSANIYIDSVQQVAHNDNPALLISGTLPDACTMLGSASHRMTNSKLTLELSAWRNPNAMCAQVLTPFSFIYDRVDASVLNSKEQIGINNSTYSY